MTLMDNSNTNLIVAGIVLICLVPLVLLSFTAMTLYRMARGALEPDAAGLHRRLERLQQQNPQASRDTLVQRVINEQARLSGIIGAVTGLGGVITLPLGIAIDLALTLRIQASLVTFIEQVYGAKPAPGVQRVRNMVIMSGGGRATEWTSRALLRLMTRVLGQSFAKLIPIVGAVLSFAVNYAILQAVGRAALRWYAPRGSSV